MDKIYTDGSGDGRIAWYNETTGESWSGRENVSSNNEAEYLAVIRALESVKSENVKIVSDSKLVVNQMKREWHIKEDNLRKLFDEAQKVIKDRKLNAEFEWTPRENNPAGKYLG